MKDSNQIINAMTNTKLQDNSQTQSMHSTIGDYEKKATIYLFTNLESVYGAKWRQSFATPESLSNARNLWANEIGKFSRQDIDQAIKTIIDLRKAGDPVFEWPDLAKIIALMEGKYQSEYCTWQHQTQAYKPFDKSRALEQLPADKEHTKQVINDLKSMFDQG